MTSFGFPHLHLRRADSTNDRARELAKAGAPSGTIVTADEQTAGRGRHGRVWSAPPGAALLFTAVLAPLERDHMLLPLSVPVAVCEAIESVADVRAQIKWPNDVWIDEAKVSGVLIEAYPPHWAVIGVGVNLAIAPDQFPADLRWPAASVGHGVTVPAMREALCERLGAWVEAPEADTLQAFRQRDALIGREVGWQGAGIDPGFGRAIGIDERGNLQVEVEGDERVSLGAGEVSLRIERGD